MGLDLAKAIGAANVFVYCNSKIVTSQVNDDYECKNEWTKKYLEEVKNQVNDLQAKFVQIPWEENEHANSLAKVASTEHMLISNQVLSFVQISPLINSISVQEIGSKNNWTTPITSYLKDKVLPDGKGTTRNLKVQVVVRAD